MHTTIVDNIFFYPRVPYGTQQFPRARSMILLACVLVQKTAKRAPLRAAHRGPIYPGAARAAILREISTPTWTRPRPFLLPLDALWCSSCTGRSCPMPAPGRVLTRFHAYQRQTPGCAHPLYRSHDAQGMGMPGRRSRVALPPFCSNRVRQVRAAAYTAVVQAAGFFGVRLGERGARWPYVASHWCGTRLGRPCAS